MVGMLFTLRSLRRLLAWPSALTICSFRSPFLFVVHLCSLFWRLYKRYSSTGQDNPALWRSFSHGDTVVDYLFALLRKNSFVMELVNSEFGAAGLEEDDSLETGAGTRTMTATRGKRKLDANASAFQSLVDSSASMAASAARHTRFAEMVSLSATLKNFRDCSAAPELIKSVERQLEETIKATVGNTGSTGPRAGTSEPRHRAICSDSGKVPRGEVEVGGATRSDRSQLRRRPR